MGMNFAPGGGDDQDVVVDINTTPLIDVMLVLLIMLIITIPLQTDATKMDLPVGTPPAQVDPPPPVVNIDVDFDGLVYWNGAPVATEAALDDKLRDVAQQRPQPEVHLKPNKLVIYRHVLAVLAAAQRLNVTKIGLVGNEQFAD